jgi:hypothetical protein
VVRGVDDALVDGDKSFRILLAPAVSDDASYNNLDGADVSAINRDNDAPALSISPARSTLTEGTSATFTVTRPGSTSGTLRSRCASVIPTCPRHADSDRLRSGQSTASLRSRRATTTW